MSAASFTAVILAAQRPGIVNPLAESAGVSHKCLVPIAGEPLIAHVMRVLAAMPDLSRLRISVERALWPVIDDLAQSLGRTDIRIDPVAPRASLADSVADALADADGPFIITTADNVLLTAEAVSALRDTLRASDVAAVLTTRTAVRAIHPEAQRRFYRFGAGHYSNCNLYGIRHAAALNAADIFREGGQFRRHVGRAIRAFGLINILLVLSGRLSLDGAARRLGRRLGLEVRALVLDDGALAIDVDNDRTHRIAEAVLLSRQPEKTEPRPLIAASGPW